MTSSQYAVLVIAAAAAVNPGCSCSSSVSGCSVDDDCRTEMCDPGRIPACMMGTCGCQADLPLGDIGRFSAMALRGGVPYVCAYNASYGDLMIGHQTPPGVVSNWEFADGVPADAVPDNPLSQVRGGIRDHGDDVGRYCSIAITPAGDPVMSYYDATHQALRFGSFGAVRWHAHAADPGMGMGATGDDVGRYTSLTIDHRGNPAIAYYAEVAKGKSGMRESQLRYATATRPDPSAAGDWQVTVIDSQPMPMVLDPKNPPALPDGIAVFVSSARKTDDTPVIAYYDRVKGNLMYVSYDIVGHTFAAPIVLDGEDGMGNKTADVGLYPSVVVDADGTAHIAYVDASHEDLLYVNTKTRTPEVVDDGYRAKDEATLDGLPAPVFHRVGDSSSIQLSGDRVIIAYQDSTVLQLRLAQRDPTSGMWKHQPMAGHATPFSGSYGFYAQNRVSGGQAILSSSAINQHVDPPQFYVEIFSVLLSSIVM